MKSYYFFIIHHGCYLFNTTSNYSVNRSVFGYVFAFSTKSGLQELIFWLHLCCVNAKVLLVSRTIMERAILNFKTKSVLRDGIVYKMLHKNF